MTGLDDRNNFIGFGLLENIHSLGFNYVIPLNSTSINMGVDNSFEEHVENMLMRTSY